MYSHVRVDGAGLEASLLGHLGDHIGGRRVPLETQVAELLVATLQGGTRRGHDKKRMQYRHVT